MKQCRMGKLHDEHFPYGGYNVLGMRLKN